jgi:hypothetical protein
MIKLLPSGLCILLNLPMVFGGSPEAAKASDRPNILVIMSDDQGVGDIGFNNPLVRTPALDRLAGQSAVFPRFSACPACSPSRASFMTGRNFLHTGVWGVGPRAYINRDETLLPEFLRRAGYQTAHFGKWGEGWTPDQMPQMRGYNSAVTTASYAHRNPQLNDNGKSIRPEGWTVDILTDLTIDFIRRESAAKKPWFAMAAYISPHAPWECDPAFSEPYERRGLSKDLATFFGMVTQMDQATGRLLAALDELGIAGNTIVVFLSDNGPTPHGEGLSTPTHGEDWKKRNPLGLRGEKATAWENALRVPFILSWPGHIASGQRLRFATIEDVLPTLLDLAAVDPASVQPRLPFHGKSFKASLLDARVPAGERSLFTIPVVYEGAPPPDSKGIIEDPSGLSYGQVQNSVTGERFKYHSLPGGQGVLYDLESDPGESADVSSAHPDVARKMAAECRAKWDDLLAARRCFQMPATLIGDPRFRDLKDCVIYVRPDIVPGNTARKVAGTVTCPFKGAKGFTQPGDSVEYAIEVMTAGTYAVSVEGTGLDQCAPLTVKVGGKRLSPGKISPTKVDFGSLELGIGRSEIVVAAAAPPANASPAVLHQIQFSRAH